MSDQIKTGGDCYQAAFQTFEHNPEMTGIMVCHGIVSGQGSLSGHRIAHAWNEWGAGESAIAIDRSNGKKVILPRSYFYAIGNIKADHVKRYTMAEARHWAVESGHFGPWEPGHEAPTIQENSKGEIELTDQTSSESGFINTD